MDIAELVEIALANSDQRRVEVATLEPAGIAMEAVSGLAQIIAELVDNSIAFSEPEDLVRVTGHHHHGDYLISISDRGVGIPEHLINELNRVLEDPEASTGLEPRLGIPLVARLAARHHIGVRLVPGARGTTARVTVPEALVGEPGRTEPRSRPRSEDTATSPPGHRLPPRESVFTPGDEQSVDLSGSRIGHRSPSGVVAMSEEARHEAEAFLEKVFAPLLERPGVTERPPPPPPDGNGNGFEPSPPEVAPSEKPSPEQPSGEGGTVTALRVRVPGENFTPVEDDPSTIAAESAIDIRTALSTYARGRRSAEESKDT